MKYLIVLILLVGCGIKPSASCDVDTQKETMKEIKEMALLQAKGFLTESLTHF